MSKSCHRKKARIFSYLSSTTLPRYFAVAAYAFRWPRPLFKYICHTSILSTPTLTKTKKRVQKCDEDDVDYQNGDHSVFKTLAFERMVSEAL